MYHKLQFGMIFPTPQQTTKNDKTRMNSDVYADFSRDDNTKNYSPNT
jgi:hypothetical protein